MKPAAHARHAGPAVAIGHARRVGAGGASLRDDAFEKRRKDVFTVDPVPELVGIDGIRRIGVGIGSAIRVRAGVRSLRRAPWSKRE
jgi:hypothetical protein